jgi:hypothetical protein
MALSEEKPPSERAPRPDAPQSPATKTTREGAPAWVVPLYVGGLALLYVGERVLSSMETGRWAVSGVGLSCVLAATAARFVPTWQAGGERGRIERLLGLLSVLGLAGLVLYLGTTEFGLAKLGLAEAEDETREQVTNLLTIGWVGLVALGVIPMLFAEAALYPMRNAERLESRRVRAAAASGFVIAMAAAYGSLFVYAAGGAGVQANFSYFKTSDPSDSTRKLIEGLGEPIQVTAFFPEVSPVRREVEGYLKKLSEGVPTLKWAIYDRYLDPKIAKDLKIVRDGEIVISKGEAKRTVNVGTEIEDARAKLKTLDRDFQLRLYKLLRARRTIYLTVGHGEINDEDRGVDDAEGRTARILKELLGKQHYLVKNLGLTQGLGSDIPDDADIIMVLGPSQPFAPEEIESLKQYAKKGGKVFIALDPDAIAVRDLVASAPGGSEPPVQVASATPAPGKSASAPSAPAPSASAAPVPEPASAEATPRAGDSALSGLRALASIAGLEFEPTILANDKQFVRRRYNDSDRTLLITNRFSSHASVSTLSRNSARAAVLFSGSGALDKAKGSTVKADVALRAMATTFNDANRNYRIDEPAEKRSSFGLAYAVSQPAAGAAPKAPESPKTAQSGEDKGIAEVPTPGEMRAFVIADADALTDVVLANFMTNQLLLVDAVRWLGGEESFAGEVNTEEDIRIEHTQQKDLAWFYSTIFGVPAVVLGLGVVISRRARKPRGGKK